MWRLLQSMQTFVQFVVYNVSFSIELSLSLPFGKTLDISAMLYMLEWGNDLFNYKE